MKDLSAIKPLEAITTWQDASNVPDLNSHATARRYLESFGKASEFITAVELNMRMALGNFFVIFQERSMYEKFGYTTWTDFRKDGLKEFGLSEGLVAAALSLAKSKTLQAMPPAERGQISVSNGIQIAKHERVNGHVKPDVIEMAKTMPTGEFITATGGTTGGWVRAWVPDKEAAPHVARIVEFCKKLSASAADAFADLLESDEIKLLAGDGTDNDVDCLIAAMQIAIQNEIDQAKAREEVLAS